MTQIQNLLHDWQMFYTLTGTAGATLAGLMFVAVTMIERVLRQRSGSLQTLRLYSEPALLAFVFTLVLSALLLMPDLSATGFDTLMLAAGLVSVGYNAATIRQLVKGSKGGWDASDWLWYCVVPLACSALLLIAGVFGLRETLTPAFTIFGVTLLLLLMMGIRNAWDMVTFSIGVSLPEQDDPA